MIPCLLRNNNHLIVGVQGLEELLTHARHGDQLVQISSPSTEDPTGYLALKEARAYEKKVTI